MLPENTGLARKLQLWPENVAPTAVAKNGKIKAVSRIYSCGQNKTEGKKYSCGQNCSCGQKLTQYGQNKFVDRN